jgi:peptidoglycan/LPS O-acetylase OafA/YrhL
MTLDVSAGGTAPLDALAGPPVAAPKGTGHMWEIDVVRLFAFTAVISVHSLAFTQVPANQVAAGFMLLLQFGREVFFSISGFVLVLSTLGRPVRSLPFWRRRIPYVLIPYLVWSTIYYAVGFATGPHGPWSWSTLGRDVLYRGAEYHLYFLLVTLQLYLVFPLLVRFIRRTAGHAIAVLVVVGTANLAWFGVLQYGHFQGWAFKWSYELLPSYAVYVLAGGYAAIHRERLQAMLAAHRARALTIAAACTAGALALYAAQLGSEAPRVANGVLQPAMFFSCVAATLALCVVAQRWVGRGMRGRAAVKVGSDISFGVYLAHPLVLLVLVDHGLGNGRQAIPSPLATPLGIIGAIAGASLLCLAVRRTRLALPLIGRPQERARPPAEPGPGRRLGRDIFTKLSALPHQSVMSRG